MDMNNHVFVARQAIFNRRHQVVGYELLYRESLENHFPERLDPHVATSRVITNSHFHLGIEALTEGKPALINLSEECIHRGIAHLLPKDKVILEVLETVPPSDEVYTALQRLFHEGYKIALDDFVLSAEWVRFLNVVRLVKIDIQATAPLQLRRMVEQLKKRPNIRLLAEKIETEDEMNLTKDLGFKFFQGYYLSHPAIHSQVNSDPMKHCMLMTIREVMREDIRLPVLEKYFTRDSRLLFKLFRYLNSGQFPVKVEIRSVGSALRYLGTIALRRFVTLIATSLIGSDHGETLVKQGIVHAAFAERIAKEIMVDHEQAFLVGLLSALPEVLGVTTEQLINAISVETEIQEGLREYHTSFSPLGKKLNHIRRLTALYDNGQWYQSQKLANVLSIPMDNLPTYYQQSIQWTDEFLNHSLDELNQTGALNDAVSY